jgi:hypothetical protein
MTAEDDLPQDGQVRVNLAMQVAGIAAQVSAALQSGDTDRCDELVQRLTQARVQLQRGTAPEGLVPFIEVMCGLLRGDDVSARAEELGTSYRAVYDQVVDEVREPVGEGELTLGEVLAEVAYNVIALVRHGTGPQQSMMAQTLLKMQQESQRRPDLQELIVFLSAARALLLDEDPSPYASQLSGPFQAEWEEILNGLNESGEEDVRQEL